MQRVKRSTAVAVLPNPPEGGTPGYFAAPNHQGGIDATVPGYEWFNAVQEEICAVVEAAGIELDEGDRTQLVAALIKTGMQGSHFSIANAAGTADAITAVFTPAIAALTHGMTLHVRAAAANATTAPTFTPAAGTIAAKTIVKGNNLQLAAGDIAGAGHWLTFSFDQTLDKWVLKNPATGISPVSQKPGEICFFACDTAPTGFLKANGAAISRTVYAALFAVIGTTFGVGDGATTFNLPDLRGEFVRGYDDGRGIDSGRTLGSWQKGSLIAVDTGTSGTPGIASYSTRSQSGTNPTGSTSIAQSDIGVDPINTSDYPQVALVGADGSTAPNIQSGSTYGTSGSARPRNVAMLACIKY